MPDNVFTCGNSLYGKRRREIKSSVIFSAVASVLLFILAAFIIVNNFVFVKVMVSGSSMKPTLYTGDLVSVNVYRTPTYGDIIVISGEKNNGDWLIKRAIAFGGDTVRIEYGNVYLKKSGEADFTKLNEPYLGEQGITFWDDPRASGYTVQEGQIFYLGDNRTNSMDSRSEYGTCREKQIVGVVSEFALHTKGINKFFDNIAVAIRDFLNF